MSVLWKKINFYQEKNDCKAIIIAAASKAEPSGVFGVSGVKTQKLFGSIMSLRQLNDLQWD